MILRACVTACAVAAAVLALWLSLRDGAAWPMLTFAALVLAGTVFERFGYRGSETGMSGDWKETPERFRDEESGRLVVVWTNAETGERRYVER